MKTESLRDFEEASTSGGYGRNQARYRPFSPNASKARGALEASRVALQMPKLLMAWKLSIFNVIVGIS